MSYDWRVEDHSRNFTWNIMPMYYLAMERTAHELYKGIGSFSDLNGRPCRDLIEPFAKMAADMERYKEIYEVLNPKNNWGNYDTALENLEAMRYACVGYPDEEFFIS